MCLLHCHLRAHLPRSELTNPNCRASCRSSCLTLAWPEKGSNTTPSRLHSPQPPPAQLTLQGKLQIILLDFGLAEELTPAVRRHFISFLNMISKGEPSKILIVNMLSIFT